MALSLLINSVEYIDYADMSSLEVVCSLKDRADSLQDLIIDIIFSGGSPEVVVPEAKREITFADGATKYFAGTLQRVREEVLEIHPTEDRQVMRYKIKCVGYQVWFDRRLVAQEYASQTADVIIKDIVDNFVNVEGENDFTYNNVGAGLSVTKKDYRYVAPTRVLDELAGETGYLWWIDYDKDVHFQPAVNSSAPVIDMNLETEDSVWDFEIEEVGDQIINRVFLLDAKTIAVDTEGETAIIDEPIGVGDGTAKFFSLLYEPGSLDSMTLSAGMKVYTSANRKLKVDFQDGRPEQHSAETAFCCFDNRGIAFGDPPDDGDVINITTDYLNEGVILMTEDPESQAFHANREGTTGVYEDALSVPDMVAVDEDTVRARGDLLILPNRFPKFIASFKSYDVAWDCGQHFRVTSDRRLGGFTNKDFYVLTVERKIIHVEATDSKVVESTIVVADDIWGE